MKGLLKNLGLILILVGVVILLGLFLYRQCKQQRYPGYLSSTGSTGTHFLYSYQ